MKKIEILILVTVLSCVSLFAASIGSVSVGTSETQVLPAKASRTSFIIGNPSTSANSVFIKYDSSTNAVTLANGIELVPGASLSITATSAANPSRNRITAIAPATTTITVSEDDAR
jgi:hypothetical protein